MLKSPIRPANRPSFMRVASDFQEISLIREQLNKLKEEFSASLKEAQQSHKTGISDIQTQFKKESYTFLKSEVEKLLKKAETELVNLFAKVRAKADALDSTIESAKKITKGDQGLPGKDGATPKAGVDFFTEKEKKAIINELAARLKPAKDGVAGKDAILTNEILWDMIEKLPKGKRFKMEHVDGLDQTLSALRNLAARGGVRGGGDTVTAGSNVTITTDAVGRKVIASSGSGGTGFQTPTGTVNGSNQIFVFATAPNAVVVDQGRAMQKTSSDGTVNWTGTTTITLTVAPNFDIYGVA